MATTDKEREITLETIAQMKEEKRQQIEAQREKIEKRARAVFAPMEPAANKAESIVRMFNRGMAVFDGVMLGMKIMNSVRSIFRRKKR
jgi:vacuolar-type H+-ATPase subunit H